MGKKETGNYSVNYLSVKGLEFTDLRDTKWNRDSYGLVALEIVELIKALL
jgi:hypothetical protein